MEHQPIQAVLFDLDDTLWPIAPVIARAELVLHDWLTIHAPRVAQQCSIASLRERRMALLLAQPEYRIDLSALRHTVLREAFLAAGEDPAQVDAAMAVFLQARNAVTLFEDVLPLFARLQGRVALGAVTNGVADLEAIGLARYFQTTLAAHRFGVAKPAPEIFLAACAALGVAPNACVHVGDDLDIDVAGARHAGLQAVWLNRGGLTLPSPLPAHVAAHASFHNLHDLHDWLAPRLAAR
ncbi:MAG: HAD family hydrolase [Proteobacteria bacterium]|nr:HAD family hydrolase [Pseudomonadota bacterium]